jgi:type II secretory pathway component PulK
MIGRRREGFILIAALWLLVALGAVGLDAALRSRTRRLAAANMLDGTRARAAAHAGTEYARSRLTPAMLDRADELRADALERARTSRQQRSVRGMSVNRLFRNSDPTEDPWREPEELIAPDMAFGDARYTLRVRDTGAALNLNIATDDMIRQFFAQGLKIDYTLADQLTQSIGDWRDEDDVPRVGGGERDEYMKAGLPVLPPNRDFAELDELRHVRGMTPDLFEAAKPYLTLVGSGRINVNSAPEPVLLAVPGMTPAAATALMALRESGQVPRNMEELRTLIPASASSALRDDEDQGFMNTTTFSTNEVDILSEGRVEGSPIRVVAHVIVARSNTGAVVVWQRID